ncbi:MAG: hypothetical protein A4E41_01614 [Methanoregulaceae archaeon PtaU1.Bin066]|jgi:hypothetical protein|nr:MAG: hypothetical protein A4E41_01614 [Methanoregulaceae archaeon PtaU1.Bin066]
MVDHDLELTKKVLIEVLQSDEGRAIIREIMIDARREEQAGSATRRQVV